MGKVGIAHNFLFFMSRMAIDSCCDLETNNDGIGCDYWHKYFGHKVESFVISSLQKIAYFVTYWPFMTILIVLLFFLGSTAGVIFLETEVKERHSFFFLFCFI